MDVRETPKGYALDLGSLYAYSDGGHVGFWWGASGLNTAFQSAESVREFIAARLAELDAETLAHPQYARKGQ